MENQNNNKNGLFGLAIIIGLAILVAAFCTPWVAHAESTKDISSFSKFSQYSCQLPRYDGQPSGYLKNTKGVSFISIYVNGTDKFYLNYIPYYEGISWSDLVVCLGRYNGIDDYKTNISCNNFTSTVDGTKYWIVAYSASDITITTPYSITGGYKFGALVGQTDLLIGEIANNSVSIADENAKGSEDNPEYDEDIGYLLFTQGRYNCPDGILEQGFFNGSIYLAWKNSTSSGQSLIDYYNKYTSMYYEYYVENLCTYVHRDSGETIKFTNYGERTAIKSTSSLNGSTYMWIDGSFLEDEFEDIKTDIAYLRYAKSVDFCFKVYVRPKFCTNSLTVIPDPSSDAEWVCGRWNSATIHFEELKNAGNNIDNETGEFDDDGNWIGDNNEGQDMSTGTITSDSKEEFFDKLQNPQNLDVSDYVGNLKSLADEVKVIPSIIAGLLSFLPPWVLTLIALSIGTICVLMIIKFIRG